MDQNLNDNTQGGDMEPNCRYTGNVLVVEDCKTNQKLITILLTKLGFEVDIAENGQEALDKVAAKQYRIIFMDMQMPVMNGYEAAGALRERKVKTPIIALTANAMVGDKEKCLQAGCDMYLAKPIERKLLLELIDSALEMKSDDLSDKVDECKNQIEELNQMCKNAGTNMNTTAPSIDLKSALKSCGDEEVVLQIAQSIVETGPELLESLTNAINQCQAKDTLLYAHRLKGNALTLGAFEFADKAQLVEDCGRDEDIDKAASLMFELKAEFKRLINFLSLPNWLEQVKNKSENNL